MASNPYLQPGKAPWRQLDDLSPSAAVAEAARLGEAIRFHDHRYYVLDDPVIADGLYDRLFRRLQDVEERFPEARLPDSPTARVAGTVLPSLPEVAHLAPMLSLDSSADPQRFREFAARVARALEDQPTTWVAEPKFDGLSIEIVYRTGRYERAATRGDGSRGEQVTESVRTIRSLPMRLLAGSSPPPALLALRGEVLMPLAGFHELNRRRIEAGEEPFANPRNAAAGAIRQLDTRIAATRPLDIFFYDVLAVEGAEAPATQWETLQWLRSLGLKVSAEVRHCPDPEAAIAYHDELEARRDELPYEVDGVVIKVDRRDQQDALGTRSRNPRWAFAFKFAPREEVTRVQDIILQVGRTGILAPVALLAPVEVGGVTIARASLHNFDQVREKDIRPGDLVRVHRAGDVIPYVVERVDDRPDDQRHAPFEMPAACPVCGSHVERDGAFFVCTGGIACRAQLEGAVIHWASRGAMDIEGLGERTVRQLVESGLVTHSVADLYRLRVEQLLPLDLFGEIKATNLVNALAASRATTLGRFVHALGIRHVGEHIAEVLAREFVDLAELMAAEEDRLLGIHEIGPQVAHNVREFFHEPRNRAVIDDLLRLGLDPKPPERRAAIFSGERFVITGGLDRFTRAAAGELIESLGGRVTGSVSKQTDYVIVGRDPGSKAEKALELGVRTLDEEQFLALLREHGVAIPEKE